MATTDQGGPSPKILIVDDRPENLYSLEIILKRPGVEIISATSGSQALRELLNHEIALILMDVQMPEMDGFETAELIRTNQKTQYIPIIFITAFSKDDTHVFKGYESGAVDYIFKPLVPEILKTKVDIFLSLYTQKKTIELQNQRLNRANHKILQQQESMIEEERVKVVLQMAGATAHELSQPLMVLLGNVDLLIMDGTEDETASKIIQQIQTSGRRLAEIVQRIQRMDHSATQLSSPHPKPLNPGHEFSILYMETGKVDLALLRTQLRAVPHLKLIGESSIKAGLEQLSRKRFDLALLGRQLAATATKEEIKALKQKSAATPFLGIADPTDLEADFLDFPMDISGCIFPNQMEEREILSQVQSCLEKFRLNRNIQAALKKMAVLSTRDELTGLFNRRYMKEILKQEFKRAQRYELPLSCLLLDLDHFKDINDTYGHDCGDQILKEFSLLLKQGTRESDHIFRYGGEEFLVLLPQTDVDGARQLADSIGEKCRSTPFECRGERVKLTVSIGLAANHSCKAAGGMDLIKCADKALYHAKGSGRNCLRIYGEAQGTDLPQGIKNPDAFLEAEMQTLQNRTKQTTMHRFHVLIREMGGAELETETRRTAEYVREICDKLEMSSQETQSILHAAFFNNCFRFLMGDAILSKPGTLSPGDQLTLEELPGKKQDLIEMFDGFKSEKKILVHHSERFDGQGYPNALTSQEIPIGSRVLALGNAVSAMESHRPYRPKLSPDKVISELVENAGTQFDPKLVGIFLDIVDEKGLLSVTGLELNQARETLNQRTNTYLN